MALQGPIPVEFGVVFPSGAYAAGAFEPVRNFDASTGEKFVQSHDKATARPLWVIEVIDPDPQARTRAVKVTCQRVWLDVEQVRPAPAAPVDVPLHAALSSVSMNSRSLESRSPEPRRLAPRSF